MKKVHPLTSVILITATLGVIKIALYYLHFEPFSFGLSTLFAGALTGTIFLLGFILAGVLSDYKESERMPSELATAISSIWLEAKISAFQKDKANMEMIRRNLIRFVDIFRDDFLIQRKNSVFDFLDSFWKIFAAFDVTIPATFMVRMRTDHSNIRRIVSRIRTIRDTSFSDYGYLMLKMVIAFFVIAMLLLKVEPFVEGLFFLCFFSFVLIAVFRLIRDMDDPFDYGLKHGKDEVNFEELYKIKIRLENDKWQD